MITDYILMFGLKILPNNLSDVRLAGMVELELMESQQRNLNEQSRTCIFALPAGSDFGSDANYDPCPY